MLGCSSGCVLRLNLIPHSSVLGKNKGAVESTTEEDWLLLEWLYAQGTGKGEAGEFRRKDLATLLANWNGEIQRAHTEAQNRGADFLKKKNAVASPSQKGGGRL